MLLFSKQLLSKIQALNQTSKLTSKLTDTARKALNVYMLAQQATLDCHAILFSSSFLQIFF